MFIELKVSIIALIKKQINNNKEANSGLKNRNQ